LRYQNKGDLKA